MVGQIPVKEGDSIDPGLSNVNRLPMGFPRPIFQASPTYQKNKHSLPSQGSQFQGFQQLSKMSPNNSSTDMKIFNFQLSNVGNDTHQDKTNNPQPNTSNSTHPQFNCPQSIQDKMTSNRAVSSSQLTPPRMTEAEEKSCNTWKNIRKSYVQRKVPVRKVPHFVPDKAHERRGTTGPHNPAYATRKSRPISGVHTRSYRDRVIHLLALKDYKKSELLVQLQEDGIKINDSNFLGKILLQVANLNATTLSYTLKDSIFKEVQRDWPGYNEEDKQSLDTVLSRKLHPFHNVTKATHCKESSVVSKTDDASSSKDHFHYLSGIDTLMKNKGGLFPPKSSLPLTSNGQESGNSEKSIILPLSATTTKYIPSPLPTSHMPISNSPLLMKSNHNVCNAPERSGTQNPCDSNSHDSGMFERENNKCTSLEAPSCVSVQKKYSIPREIQHFMPEKFKCTFAKRKTTIPNNIISMMEKQKLEFKKQDEIMKSNSNKEVKKVFPDSGKTCFTSETPDYLTNYSIIVSPDQRQCYEKQFRADYSEYQATYDKIQISCTPIINLDSERKAFSPGSKEYQDITKKISVAYQKMRQLNPKFCEEKDRCVFLYNKLVHIKKLINDFDQQGHLIKINQLQQGDDRNCAIGHHLISMSL
ncbi:RNA polymerase II elongation factor ELL2-like protein [Cricetulus griseus]|uniref:RNA polymerase II elongation factor ELL2-like protein n=1 Tax=Cricetulus griseus TaxID=10029 RepID=A0A061HWJ4_CRIGR|nr:RNA polymerase II elongation factor ELL2-like protein [Cricetulus griseus]